MWIFLIIFSAFYLSVHVAPSVTTQPNKDEYQLEFVQILFRHGNRTIESIKNKGTYENDPYKNVKFWSGGYDHLTDAGKQLHFQIGKYLRRRYACILGPDYSPSKIRVQSTDTKRTYESAQYNTAGIFSPDSDNNWRNALQWQPKIIQTVPRKKDYILGQNIPCKMVDKLRHKYVRSDDIRAQLDEYSAFRAYLEEKSGSNVRKMDDFYPIYDSLNIERQQGLPTAYLNSFSHSFFRLSNWANFVLNKYNSVLEYFVAVSYQSYVVNNAMKKAKCGFLIQEMFKRFENKALGLSNSDLRLCTYFTHEGAIIKILSSLNIYKFDVPSFGASLAFEMYRKGQEHFVQLVYKTDDSYNEYPSPIPIPDCGTMCPLDKFFELYKDILPNDDDTFDSLCQN